MTCILFLFYFDWNVVTSGSMEPGIKVGAVVMIDPHRMVETGDAALYESGAARIVHRVLEEREDGYVFKGDNNPAPDFRIVGREEVRGPVVLTINACAPVVRFLLQLEDS